MSSFCFKRAVREALSFSHMRGSAALLATAGVAFPALHKCMRETSGRDTMFFPVGSRGRGHAVIRCEPSKPFKKNMPHISETVVEAAIKLAKHVVIFGVGEGEKAHGFTLIIGDASDLCSKDDDGIPRIGESNLGDEQSFQNHNPLVTSKGIESNRLVRAAFKEDGAIVIDGATGAFKNMNYMVCDIRKGDNVGGARHRSASAVAQLGKTSYVIKASEEVTKTGDGHLDIFRGAKKPFKEPVRATDAGTIVKKQIYAGELLIETAMFEQAISVYTEMLQRDDPISIHEQAQIYQRLANAEFQLASPGVRFDTNTKPHLEKAMKAVEVSLSLWAEAQEEHFNELERADALQMQALVCSALSRQCAGVNRTELLDTAAEAARGANQTYRKRDSRLGAGLRVEATVYQARFSSHPDFKFGASAGPQFWADGDRVLELDMQACQWFEQKGLTDVADYPRALKAVGRLYECRGQLGAAHYWFHEAARVYESVQGRDHFWPKRYREDLVGLLEKLGKHSDAEDVRSGAELDLLERPEP